MPIFICRKCDSSLAVPTLLPHLAAGNLCGNCLSKAINSPKIPIDSSCAHGNMPTLAEEKSASKNQISPPQPKR